MTHIAGRHKQHCRDWWKTPKKFLEKQGRERKFHLWCSWFWFHPFGVWMITCRSGSEIRSSTKCQPPFVWLPLPSLTSRVRALSEETLIISGHSVNLPLHLSSPGSGDLVVHHSSASWFQNAAAVFEQYLDAKCSRIYPDPGHRNKKLLYVFGYGCLSNQI